jgi:formamidopyrimidine-DNA glycosylase
MPELPEVETVRKGLAPAMEGQTVLCADIRRADLRFPFPENLAEMLQGQQVTSLRRRAKYLLMGMSNGQTLIMHLGMSGAFRIEKRCAHNTVEVLEPEHFVYKRSKLAIHDHVIFHLSNGLTIIYNDPRRFGFMVLCPSQDLKTHAFLKNLGPEPDHICAKQLALILKNQKRAIKNALLDQRLIAGLGNIYVCEALYRARIAPTLASYALVTARGQPKKALQDLVVNIQNVIHEAILAGGSSLRDHTKTDGSMGYFQHHFAVYGRDHEPCLKKGCTGIIERLVQSGRSTFFCPQCQG